MHFEVMDESDTEEMFVADESSDGQSRWAHLNQSQAFLAQPKPSKASINQAKLYRQRYNHKEGLHRQYQMAGVKGF